MDRRFSGDLGAAMFWVGLFLALASIGRVVGLLVLGAVVIDGDSAGGGSSLVFVTVAAGVVAVAYIVWFAFTGHEQLRAVPAQDRARGIVVVYGLLLLAVVPLVDLGVYRWAT